MHSFKRSLGGLLIFASSLGLLAVPVASSADTNNFFRAPGTVRMANRLAEWARTVGQHNPFDNAARLKAVQQRLAQDIHPAERFKSEALLASLWLNAGEPEKAVLISSNLLAIASAPSSDITLDWSSHHQLAMMEAMAYLRLGEVENCLDHHNPDSCLIPISPQARHGQPRGATNAEAILLELAKHDTNDLSSRWLLNVAAMTLGHYPDGVPAALRIPPSVFQSEFPEKKFPEIAAQVGLAEDGLAGGTVAEDFDGDGLLDVFLTSWSVSDQCHFFKNMGNGHFEDRTSRAGLTGITGGLNAMQGDYNNDGFPDIYITRGAWIGEFGKLPDSLLRNNGDGTFSDVTEEVGLLSFHPDLSAVWFDANNDGWLDLLVGNESRNPTNPHPCELFLNDGGGHFKECAVAAGVNVRSFVRGVTAGDFDNDGWPDLYISCLFSDNILLRNDGRNGTNKAPGVHFTAVTSHAGVAAPLHSFPTWFFDYDNDGWLDIFTCGYGVDDAFSTSAAVGNASLHEVVADKLGLPSKGTRPALYHNNHNGTFTDVAREMHLHHILLAMGSNFGDLDNDGWLDFYLGTGSPYIGMLIPNEMFRNDGGKRFQNVTTAGGFGHLQKGHAIAFADLNNDGQQDVMLNVGGAFPGDNYYDALFANPGHTNHWLCLKLIGKLSNRSAIGTRIKVVARTADGTREIHRVVGSGGSFGSSPLRQEIGLGAASGIDRVEVWWPVTGKTNIVRGFEMDRFYELTEVPDAAPRLLSPRSFPWPTEHSAAHSSHARRGPGG